MRKKLYFFLVFYFFSLLVIYNFLDIFSNLTLFDVEIIQKEKIHIIWSEFIDKTIIAIHRWKLVWSVGNETASCGQKPYKIRIQLDRIQPEEWKSICFQKHSLFPPQSEVGAEQEDDVLSYPTHARWRRDILILQTNEANNRLARRVCYFISCSIVSWLAWKYQFAASESS